MNRHVEMLLLVALFLIISISMTGADYHEIEVFVGHPSVMLVGTGTLKEELKGKIPLEKLSPEKKKELACVIIKRGDKYFWKSREGYEVAKLRMPGGDLIFRRLDRADYVRITQKALRDLDQFSQMVYNDHTHHYVEHITHGLISYNYWGHVIYEAENIR